MLASLGESQNSVLAHDVVKCMKYLHHERPAPVLHRDIKPANILSNHEGRYKLADFGISAEAANHDGQFTDFVGTLLYMSPERVQGQGTYSYSADIWSFGLTIFALAMGKPPHSKLPHFDVVAAISESQPPPLDPARFPPGDS